MGVRRGRLDGEATLPTQQPPHKIITTIDLSDTHNDKLSTGALADIDYNQYLPQNVGIPHVMLSEILTLIRAHGPVILINRLSPVRLPRSHLAHSISITHPPPFTLQFDHNDEFKLILQSHGTPGHYLLSVIVRIERHTARAYYIDSLPGFSREYYAELQR